MLHAHAAQIGTGVKICYPLSIIINHVDFYTNYTPVSHSIVFLLLSLSASETPFTFHRSNHCVLTINSLIFSTLCFPMNSCCVFVYSVIMLMFWGLWYFDVTQRFYMIAVWSAIGLAWYCRVSVRLPIHFFRHLLRDVSLSHKRRKSWQVPVQKQTLVRNCKNNIHAISFMSYV